MKRMDPCRAFPPWPGVSFLVVLLLVSGTVGREGPSGEIRTRVTSDVSTLRTTILLSIGDNIFRSSEMGSGGHPFLLSGLPRGAMRQHAEFVKILRSQGVEVLDVADLLDSAIQRARQQGKLAQWIREVFPSTADRVLGRIDEINAASLLNRRREHFYLEDEQARVSPLFPGISSMYWSRDFAVSTPRGILIGHGKHYARSIENALARFIFDFAERFEGFPVVFDAEKEGVYLDGGDVIVVDEETLLVGVGNRSSREAAPLLAQRLGMDVLAVAMPPWEPVNGMRRQLLHLDSIFNLVGKRTALAVPFFLEKDSTNPMASILSGLADQIESMNEGKDDHPLGDPEALRTTVRLMPEVGWVTRFSAGTGEESRLDLKLVDHFRQKGYQVVYVGGDPDDVPVNEFALERAMYELRWQGANVVQLAPGRVIAYEHNLHTNKALRAAGVDVITFDGELLSMRNGGPHCLLMPLVRF